MRSLRYAVTTRVLRQLATEQIHMNRQDAKAAKKIQPAVMHKESMDTFITGGAFALLGGLGVLAVQS
jgi:hypothetical protein